MDRCVQKDRSICFLFIVERWLVDWLGGREIGILKFYISSVFSFPYRRSGKYIILVVGKARKVFSTACVFGPRFDRGNACIPTFFFFFFFFVWSTCFCELGRIKKYVNFTENSCFLYSPISYSSNFELFSRWRNIIFKVFVPIFELYRWIRLKSLLFISWLVSIRFNTNSFGIVID